MADKGESRRLERRAKALMIDREIPQSKMEAVRSLINNRALEPDERYRAVIELIQNCPEKRNTRRLKQIDGPDPSGSGKKQGISDENRLHSGFAPTETSYYIEDLLNRYRPLGLFKKRYLVQRGNRLGFWFKKRLIPARKSLDKFKELKKIQQSLIPLINQSMMEILNDSEKSDPFSYNLLKQIRKWLNGTPLASLTFGAVKWMERIHFEREFRDYITGFFSFLLLPAEVKENIYLVFQGRISSIALLSSGRTELTMDEHRQVHEAVAMFRSFIPVGFSEDTLLSRRVRSLCGISYSELLLAMTEVLCFQRPLNREELILHYGIAAPDVDSEKWNCSPDLLVRAGKDPLSIKRRELDGLEARVKEFTPLLAALKRTERGRNLLMVCVEEEWRYIDRKHYESAVVYEENFLAFIESLISYFNLTYADILRGTPLRLKRTGGALFTAHIFDQSWFRGYEAELNPVLDEIHFFKTKNPSLALSRKEIRKIVSGQIGSMPHIASFIRRIGEFFFTLGMDLTAINEGHNELISSSADEHPGSGGSEALNYHGETSSQSKPSSRPRLIPWHDCIIEEFEVNSVLNRRFNGKVIAGHDNALFSEMGAFCCQLSNECFNEKIFDMVNRATSVNRRIDELKKEIDNDIKKELNGK